MNETRNSRPRPPRVTLACTPCRTVKVKCDGKKPNCSHCAARDQPCTYSSTVRKRGPGKGKKRIEALEERLAAMESMLQQRGESTNSQPAKAISELVELRAGPSDNHVVPPTSRGIGPPFEAISDRFARWDQQVSTQPLKRSLLSPVVAEEPEKWLLEQALEEICSELAFMPTSWFFDLMKRPDALNLSDSWWQGLLNAIIANAVLLKAHNSFFQKVAPYGWAFFRNSYAVFPELMIQGTSVGAAQAIMAMAMFMRQSGDTTTTALLLSMAVRMQQVGAIQGGLPLLVEEENRSRLSWATFTLDAEIALNNGWSPAHSCPVPHALVKLSPCQIRTDTIFRLRAQLAEIQHCVASCLASPSTQTSDLSSLEVQLNRFFLLIPRDCQLSSDNNTCNPESVKQEGDISLLILHFNYFNALSVVSWASVRLLTAAAASSSSSPIDVDSQMEHYKALARSSARSILHAHLIFILHKPSFTTLWTLLPYSLAASLILLAVICKEPSLAEARDDVDLLSAFKRYLDRQINQNGCTDLQSLRDGISKFGQVAKDAVDAAAGAGSMPVNPALWPLSVAGGKTGKVISLLLTCEAHQPMYLAQSLMSNVINEDTEKARNLADILGIEWGQDRKYGPFVPECLMPATFGFAFGS